MSETTYAAELALATRLAVEAGRWIREEFHRPGGPRSDGVSHAEVDTEVERFVSDALRGAFPKDAFRGEETKAWGPASAARRWLVDPNDGTRAFIAGHRGSAISIGLVVQGRPVLGVVYAPTAPDDEGDLITWAEGEPLRRNGRPVERASLAPSLDGLAIVAMNHSAAGKKLAQSLSLAAPARILARPSIAYRLALVAVGEADAAISTSGPTDWDIAGGHALLRAVGGELLDSSGRPVRYDGRGHAASDVFGGHPEVAAALSRKAAERPKAGLPPPSPLEERYPHVAPSHAHKIRDAAVLSRAQGALLGQLAGDALGQLVEFQRRTDVFRRYPGGVRELVDGGSHGTLAGQATDDSEMALILARSIVAKGGFDFDAVHRAYLDWLDSAPFDVGTTTRLGLAGGDTSASESNGSCMRISPLAVHLWRNVPDAVATVAVEDASMTHESILCLESTMVLAVAIATAVREGLPPRELYAKVAAWVRSRDDFSERTHALFAGDDVGPVEDFHTNQGWVHIALRNAFHQLLHAPSFEEALVRTVSQGGDADTNGAIAGALLGAVYGRDAVPLRWRRTVLSCRATHGRHPRPTPFWADDLYELAERLLALGTIIEIVETPTPENPQVVPLEERRRRQARETAAREAFHRELERISRELYTAASELGLAIGLPVPNDARTDEWGVDAITRGLASSRDPELAAAGESLRLLQRILAGTLQEPRKREE